VVVCGCGAAGFTCAKYFVSLGVKKENLIAVDVQVGRAAGLSTATLPIPCWQLHTQAPRLGANQVLVLLSMLIVPGRSQAHLLSAAVNQPAKLSPDCIQSLTRGDSKACVDHGCRAWCMPAVLTSMPTTT